MPQPNTPPAQAGPALPHAAECLALVLADLQAVAWTWMPERGELRAAGSLARVFGCDVLDRARFLELLHEDDRDRHLQVTANAFQFGTYHSIYRIRRPDTGTVEWLDEHARITADAGTGALHLVGVTRMARAPAPGAGADAGTAGALEEPAAAPEQVLGDLNRSLQRRLEQLEALLDALPVGVFTAHDAACSVITANRAGRQQLRLPGADTNATKSGPNAARLPFRTFRNGVEVPSTQLPMQRCTREAIAIVGEELEIVFEDGTSTHLHESVSPLFDAEGRVRGCIGAFVDVTALKQAQVALAEADRRKEDFIATLAHELRNPLAAVRHAVDLLLLDSASEAVWEKAVDVLDRQSRQLARLVDDLLDVSRISRGALELRRQLVDLRHVVADAIDSSRPLVEQQRQQLRTTWPAAPMLVDADPARLMQVVGNLLNNASKYTPEGGTIDVAGEVAADGSIVLRVRDTGIGIPPEMLKGIFEMFVQVDSSVDRAQGGLGIGLTLARMVVELHGGTLHASSAGLGHGSEFAIALPAAPAHTKPAPPVLPRSSGARRILVVDDNVDSAEMLAMFLQLDGHEVRAVHDGADAVSCALSWQPEVVLLDIGLPTISGYEVARRIREALGHHIRIVAVTGWGQPADRARTLEAGFDHHVVKPLDPARLKEILGT